MSCCVVFYCKCCISFYIQSLDIFFFNYFCMKTVVASRKHAYIILTPLKPHFYIVKLGFTGVYLIFLFLLKNIDCGYSLEPPRRGGSNEYQQSMF